MSGRKSNQSWTVTDYFVKEGVDFLTKKFAEARGIDYNPYDFPYNPGVSGLYGVSIQEKTEEFFEDYNKIFKVLSK